jgi:hypothetical protein
MAAVVAGVTLLAVPAVGAAAGTAPPPRFRPTETTVRAYATRVYVDTLVEVFDKISTRVIAEYAPAESNGQAPPEDSPAWTVFNEEKNLTDRFNNIFLGAADPGSRGSELEIAYVRHLAPNTAYYARFIAENAEGRAVETVPFKTLVLAAPELSPEHFPSFTASAQEYESRLFELDSTGSTSVDSEVKIESNGSETSYVVEYSLPENGHEPAADSSSWKPFSSNATGIIAPANEYAQFTPQATGLSPETTYYVRVRAHNAHGELVQLGTVETLTGKPAAQDVTARNVTATSAHITAAVSPHGSQTAWRLESAASPAGPWTPIPGGTGTISLGQAEALQYGEGVVVGARLEGLSTSTSYNVRVMAENQCAEGCGSATSDVTRLATSGAPSVATFMVHTLDGEAQRVLGTVNPNNEPTTAEQLVTLQEANGGTFTLTFKGQSTAPIPYDASASMVERALQGLEGEPQVLVEGSAGGPYTVWFHGANVQGAQPLLEVDGLGLAAPGNISVAVTQQGGEGYDTSYGFRFVSKKSFEANGWSEAQETPEVDAGSGVSPEMVGADLPGVMAGETYRYRLMAHNGAPGTGVVEGAEQSLTVPLTPSAGAMFACPNEALRTGLSARLPDCRAYELVTPVDKYGAQEPFHYKGGVTDAAAVGIDGEHVAVEASGVHWGAGDSPYFFTREEGRGWSMVSGSPQPETGVHINVPEIYGSDLTRLAFRSSYTTAPGHESPTVEYEVGPAGGPYQTAASVPRVEASGQGVEGWVAGNGDLSKLVLATADRTLTDEEPTPTKSGTDLYEYTAQAGLRQLNVTGEADATVGRCGAKMVRGQEGLESRNDASSPHSVSTDGSRVFFEAVPGSNCTEASHLYMRANGSETVDIGVYKFEGADAAGTTLLLRNGAGSLVGYDTETSETTPEPPGELVVATELAQLGVSYRFQPQPGEPFHHARYIYTDRGEYDSALRYDTSEHLVVCMACVSSFNPSPRLPSFMWGVDGSPLMSGGALEYVASSANGKFAFFTTPAALVAQDIDGEIPVAGGVKDEDLDVGNTTSPSSDVYEWRAGGVDGCAQARGCLALITNGRGGFYNLLLGSADEGRDVFIYTLSKLLPQDTDTAGDIYDARIDGGFAPPAPLPTECEGDACSTPASAPLDSTPASFTFSGAGNLIQTTPVKVPVKPTKAKGKKKQQKHKQVRRKKRAASRTSRRRGRGARADAGDRSAGRRK